MPEIVSDPPPPSCFSSVSGSAIQELQSLDPDPFASRARDTRGRFAKGSSGNPLRPRGIPNPNRGVLDLLTTPPSAQALSNLLDRKPHLSRLPAAQLLPPPLAVRDPAERLGIDLSPLRTNADFEQVLHRILEAVSRGEMTSAEGLRIARRVRTRMRADRRLARLERQLGLKHAVVSGMAQAHGIPERAATGFATAHGGGMATTGTHEQTINTALGEVLHHLGRAWTIRSEHVGRVFDEGGRPDILIEKPDGWPIVIEAEVGNHRQAENEAQSRLGNHLVSSANPIHASVALVDPERLRSHHGQALREAIHQTRLEYALFSIEADGRTARFPSSGWLSGGVEELAVLLHRSSIPAWRVEALADTLEAGVNRAEGSFSAAHPTGTPLGRSVAGLLGQSDDEPGQTRRMAMTVIVDALVFHAALAQAEMMVHDVQTDETRSVRPVSSFRELGVFRPTALVDEWEKILNVNYWPIFHTASSIVRVLPTHTVARILEVLWDTAEQLIVGGVTRSHDLTGVVFQRLIADCNFSRPTTRRPLRRRCSQVLQSPSKGRLRAKAGAMRRLSAKPVSETSLVAQAPCSRLRISGSASCTKSTGAIRENSTLG
jgi:NAD(P)-dependent dehydrogenase (short-subunit alcohol dehydrogenase family)